MCHLPGPSLLHISVDLVLSHHYQLVSWARIGVLGWNCPCGLTSMDFSGERPKSKVVDNATAKHGDHSESNRSILSPGQGAELRFTIVFYQASLTVTEGRNFRTECHAEYFET